MPLARARTTLAAALFGSLALAACGTSTPGTLTTTARSTPGVAQSASGSRSSRLVRNAVPQPDWRPFSGPVPILVYHELGTPPSSEPYPGLYVSDSDFQAEMQWLHQHSYQAVTLDEVMNAWFHGGMLPSKPIVITFDNGYIPQATFAPSVMSKFGWPGVLNEITAGHLSNARIGSLVSIGWEIDSHSISHPDLRVLSPGALRHQLEASRTFLQHTFHIPANSFCYPSNKYNAAVIAAVKAAGYTNALTENSGYATRANPYVLNRFEIEGGVPVLAADLARG